MSNGVPLPSTPLFGHHHRWKGTPECIAELKKAVGTGTSDVCKHHTAPVKLGENLLIDSRVVIALPSIDHDEPIAQLILHHRLHDRVEEVLHVGKVGMIRIKQAHDERARAFKCFKEVDDAPDLIA